MSERKIQFSPAFDKRDPDPSKNYGIGSVTVTFYLIGEMGATQFKMSCGWYLENVRKENEHKPMKHWGPMAWDLGYHSLTPKYEGQEPMTDSCPILGGRPCYYDGSGLNAEPVMEDFFREGDSAVWRHLENEYREVFGVEVS